MHINNRPPQKATECQQKRKHPTPHPKNEQEDQMRSQSQTRANARKNMKQTTTTLPDTRTTHHHTPNQQGHRQQTTPAPEENGTDFRYAVEFSKNGHTPTAAFRPPWGQPAKRYSVRFAVSNLPVPLPHLRAP